MARVKLSEHAEDHHPLQRAEHGRQRPGAPPASMPSAPNSAVQTDAEEQVRDDPRGGDDHVAATVVAVASADPPAPAWRRRR